MPARGGRACPVGCQQCLSTARFCLLTDSAVRWVSCLVIRGSLESRCSMSPRFDSARLVCVVHTLGVLRHPALPSPSQVPHGPLKCVAGYCGCGDGAMVVAARQQRGSLYPGALHHLRRPDVWRLHLQGERRGPHRSRRQQATASTTRAIWRTPHACTCMGHGAHACKPCSHPTPRRRCKAQACTPRSRATTTSCWWMRCPSGGATSGEVSGRLAAVGACVRCTHTTTAATATTQHKRLTMHARTPGDVVICIRPLDPAENVIKRVTAMEDEYVMVGPGTRAREMTHPRAHARAHRRACTRSRSHERTCPRTPTPPCTHTCERASSSALPPPHERRCTPTATTSTCGAFWCRLATCGSRATTPRTR
jgi:hypothetical protein